MSPKPAGLISTDVSLSTREILGHDCGTVAGLECSSASTRSCSTSPGSSQGHQKVLAADLSFGAFANACTDIRVITIVL